MAAVTPPSPAPIVLRTSTRRRRTDRLARNVFTAASLTTFLITLLIIGTLVFDAWDFIRQVTESTAGMGWKLGLTFLAATLAAMFVAPVVAQNLRGPGSLAH